MKITFTRSTNSMLFGRILTIGLYLWISFGADAAGKIAIDVELNPVGNFTAKAESVKGFAQKKVVKGAEVFEAKGISFKIDDLQSGVDLRDKHMKEQYFESKKFPLAIMKAARGQDGKFKAKLKVHGVEKIVSGKYDVSGSELTAKFEAKMSDFKIKNASYMGVGAADVVKVEVTLPVK